MNSAKSSNKLHIRSAAGASLRERNFEVSLSTLVTGHNASGREFKERTKLTSISSKKAIFRLDSGVMIGSKLYLILDIPKTIFLETHLKLNISGNVSFVKAVQNGKKKQLIFLKLDKSYKIRPTPKKTT